MDSDAILNKIALEQNPRTPMLAVSSFSEMRSLPSNRQPCARPACPRVDGGLISGNGGSHLAECHCGGMKRSAESAR